MKTENVPKYLANLLMAAQEYRVAIAARRISWRMGNYCDTPRTQEVNRTERNLLAAAKKVPIKRTERGKERG